MGVALTRRSLGLWDATAVYVGVILGSGVFVAPSYVARIVETPWAAVLWWLGAGAITVCGALCYAECAMRLPENGGFYVYYKEAFGDAVAFTAGWIAELVTYPASIAAISVVCARYASVLCGWPSQWERVVACAAILLCVGAHLVGLRSSATTQKILTALKLLALFTVCAGALLYGRDDAPAIPTDAAIGTLGMALAWMLWTYDGWTDVSMITGELREPRDLVRCVLQGSVVLFVLYATVQVAVMLLLPLSVVRGSEQVLYDAVSAAFGLGSGRWLSVVALLCTLGSLHALLLTASRLGAALGGRVLGKVDEARRVPQGALVALGGAALVYVLAAELRELVAAFSFVVWLFYGLTAVAVLRLRLLGTGGPNAWIAPYGPTLPLVVLGTSVGMAFFMAQESPHVSLIVAGALLVLFGQRRNILRRRV